MCWRLIEIGQTAGLLPSHGAHMVVNALAGSGRANESVGIELQRFRSSPAELYVLVSLFAASPHAVTVRALTRETGHRAMCGAPDSRTLASVECDWTVATACAESAFALTPARSRLAVLLIYRVIIAEG